MHVFKEISSLKVYLLGQRELGKTIGLVPTMGALHEGHSSLLKASVTENDLTVCSIFINPVQFNNQEDLENYPRTISEDLIFLKTLECDIVFIPSEEEMYPKPIKTNFNFGELETRMEGSSRPGHFNGVGLVVSKLFNIVSPTRAYFGQKDIQQIKIIEQLCSDLSFDIQLKSIDTIREADGLAMSSRNKRLSADARKKAPLINQVLAEIESGLKRGEAFIDLKTEKTSILAKNEISLEYLELVSEEDLSFVQVQNKGEKVVLCIAAVLEGIRLIDNRIF